MVDSTDGQLEHHPGGSILAIRQAGEQILRQPCRPVAEDLFGSGSLLQLVEQMHATMRYAGGVGLAANQVGVNLRMLVVEDRALDPDGLLALRYAQQGRERVERYALCNPELELLGRPDEEWFEGCLSLHGFTAAVSRHARVRVSGRSPDGALVEFEVGGWHARILQHEVDHLSGSLYIDRMRPTTFMSSEQYGKFWRQADTTEVIASLGGDSDPGADDLGRQPSVS